MASLVHNDSWERFSKALASVRCYPDIARWNSFKDILFFHWSQDIPSSILVCTQNPHGNLNFTWTTIQITATRLQVSYQPSVISRRLIRYFCLLHIFSHWCFGRTWRASVPSLSSGHPSWPLILAAYFASIFFCRIGLIFVDIYCGLPRSS